MKTIEPPNETKTARKVTIKINGADYQTHPGNHPVVQLKNMANIPKDETLCILKDGKLVPLDDKDHVDIHGGEVFASHCPSGGAS
jgi:hypothetical protein